VKRGNLMSAQNHYDLLLPEAGGRFGVTGDCMSHDLASFGNYLGPWGVLTITP